MSIREKFEKDVENLLGTKELLPLEVRIQQVLDLTEAYYLAIGKRYSNPYYLDMLGTYLLADILRDKSTHKVKLEEYPVLSYSQQRLRNRKESRVGDQNIDFIVLKEVKNHPNALKAKTNNKEDIA